MRPKFCLDADGISRTTRFFLPTQDLWLLAVLNSPVGWWHAWRIGHTRKDEALSPVRIVHGKLPIAAPSDDGPRHVRVGRSTPHRDHASRIDRRLTRSARLAQGRALPSASRARNFNPPCDLDSDSFVTEVRKLRGKKNPLSLAALKSLREEHTRTILPAQALAREAMALERKISDLVNEAYGLTPEEVELMWETAPPRMPISRG